MSPPKKSAQHKTDKGKTNKKWQGREGGENTITATTSSLLNTQEKNGRRREGGENTITYLLP